MGVAFAVGVQGADQLAVDRTQRAIRVLGLLLGLLLACGLLATAFVCCPGFFLCPVVLVHLFHAGLQHFLQAFKPLGITQGFAQNVFHQLLHVGHGGLFLLGQCLVAVRIMQLLHGA